MEATCGHGAGCNGTEHPAQSIQMPRGNVTNFPRRVPLGTNGTHCPRTPDYSLSFLPTLITTSAAISGIFACSSTHAGSLQLGLHGLGSEGCSSDLWGFRALRGDLPRARGQTAHAMVATERQCPDSPPTEPAEGASLAPPCRPFDPLWHPCLGHTSPRMLLCHV